jgi:predicted TIM-barrel fold metal-dependent hydrolase
MVIDFHTHIFPRQKAPGILSKLLNKFDIPNFTDGTLNGLSNSMKKAGIQLSLTSRITVHPEQVKAVNSWLLGCQRKNILPMATVHPDQTEGETYVEDLKKAGFKGIKLHPDYQGFYADDERMYPFYEAAQALQIPVLFHAGLDRGLTPPFKAMPKQLLRVHRDFPRLKMIAAHMGGEDNYDETEATLLGTDIYLDTAFVLRIMDESTLKRFFQNHPVERFLFGTDSPFTDQKTELQFLNNLDFLTPCQKDKIAGHNAARLLNIGSSTLRSL